MKTTLNLPDELMHAVKYRALQEHRTLQDTIADLLRKGLSQGRATGQRVQLPLVRCAHAAKPGQELTPERVADSLLEEEARPVRASL